MESELLSPLTILMGTAHEIPFPIDEDLIRGQPQAVESPARREPLRIGHPELIALFR